MVIAPCALAMEDLFGMSLSKSMPPGNGLCVINGKMYRRPKSTCSDERSHRRTCSTGAMAGVCDQLVDSLLLWPDDVRRRRRMRKARSNRNLVFGRQSLPDRSDSSNAIVINNPGPAVGVVEKVQRHASVKIKTRLAVGRKW